MTPPRRDAPRPRRPLGQGRLSPKQARFVAEYLTDLNGTQAAIRAGYAPKHARIQGSQLLSYPNIAAAVAKGKAQQLVTTDLSAIRVLEELRRIAFSDARQFYDSDGNVKAVSQWTAEQGAQVGAVETILKNATTGDNAIDRIFKFKKWDKLKALELLCKHFGLADDRLQLTGDLDAVAARLLAVRARLATATDEAT